MFYVIWRLFDIESESVALSVPRKRAVEMHVQYSLLCENVCENISTIDIGNVR